jgi:hypothetical protein
VLLVGVFWVCGTVIARFLFGGVFLARCLYTDGDGVRTEVVDFEDFDG